MVLFPNSKVNLGLRVAGKRPDGYHDLETIFFPLPLRDALEVTTCPVRKEPTAAFDLTVTGTNIPGELATNLCRKAWDLLKNDYPDIPPVRMHLHKTIPMGAGLGGGSSDGAFALQALNNELKLDLSTGNLLQYALQLGSDCPFFIVNKPCYATGRGEVMEEIALDLSDYYFVVANPGIHINTGEAFEALGAFSSLEKPMTEIIKQPLSTWRESLVNVFEKPVFEKHPEIAAVKRMFYDVGAEYASMTGTGSSVYAIFHKSKKTGNLRTSPNLRLFILNQEH